MSEIKELENKLAVFEKSDNYVLGHADGFADGYSTRSRELSPKEEEQDDFELFNNWSKIAVKFTGCKTVEDLSEVIQYLKSQFTIIRKT